MAERLADLIGTARERAGWSLRDLADECGGTPTSSTIHAIEKGRTTSDRDTLIRLARALGLPRDRVLRAAEYSTHHLGPFRLPAGADNLDRAERKVITDMVRSLLAAKRR